MHHEEIIICPECGREQIAIVTHTIPFYTYVHICECGYTIMESEWTKAALAAGESGRQ